MVGLLETVVKYVGNNLARCLPVGRAKLCKYPNVTNLPPGFNTFII
jgi:hypothetical protein